MTLRKNNRQVLLYPMAFLTLFSVLLQIITISIPGLEKASHIVTLILTQAVAPISFFIIVFLLWREPKPKIKIYMVLLLVLGAIVATFMLSMASLSILNKLSISTAANPIAATEPTGGNILLTILLVGWSMFGEEAVKLSLLFLLFRELLYNSERKAQYWVSWVVVAVIFGLLHLSTYQYSFLQSVLVVGLPVIIYGYIWKKTERPLVMWGTHYLYDTTLILISLLGNGS